LEKKTLQLEELVATMRSTVEAATDAILVADIAERITLWNENFPRLWNVPGEILDSRDHRRVLDWLASRFERPEEFLEGVARIESTAATESSDVLKPADGRLIERTSRLQRAGDHVIGRVWSYRDISDRDRAYREHAHLAAIIASSNDAIVSKTLE